MSNWFHNTWITRHASQFLVFLGTGQKEPYYNNHLLLSEVNLIFTQTLTTISSHIYRFQSYLPKFDLAFCLSFVLKRSGLTLRSWLSHLQTITKAINAIIPVARKHSPIVKILLSLSFFCVREVVGWPTSLIVGSSVKKISEDERTKWNIETYKGKNIEK